MPRERTVVLGRDEQWELLDSAVHTAGGLGSLLVVRGPSGSGKSALLEAAAKNWLRCGVRVFSVSAAAPASRMFDVLLDAVRLRVGDQQDPGLLEAVAAAARIRQRSAGAPQHNLLPLVHELTRALTHLVRRERTVLTIEDVDHIDRESASALSLLVQGVRVSGGVVLATARGTSRGAPEQLVDIADSVLDLPPLREEDIATLLVRWAGERAAVDPTMTAALRAALGPLFGNPATVRSTVHALRAEGRLVVIDEHVCLQPSAEPIALAVDHELFRVVRECGPGSDQVVWSVAVLGEVDVDDLPVLAEAAEVELHACGRALDQLVRNDVLRVANGRLRLSVPALGEAMGREDRRPSREVHGAVARHMLAQGERGMPVNRSALANHLAQAGPGFHCEDGPEILIAEAERVAEEDPALAADWYRAAVHRLTSSDRRWPRLLGAMARLQLSQGRYQELADDVGSVLPTLVEAVNREDEPAAVGAHSDDERLLVEVAICWISALLHEGRIAEIRDSMRLFDVVATRNGSTEAVRRFCSALLRGRMREATTPLTTLINTFSVDSGETQSSPVVALDEVLLLLNALEGDHEEFRRARSSWECRSPEVRHELDTDRLRDAGAMLDCATAQELILGDRCGRPRSGAPYGYQQVLRAYYTGEWDTALSVARSLEADRSPTRNPPAHHLTRVVAAEICSARGDFRRAEDWLAGLPRNFVRGHLAGWVRCGLRHRQGHTAEAVKEGWLNYLHDRDRVSAVGLERLLERLIDYSLQLGDRDGAERMLGQLEAIEARTRTPSTREAALIAGGMVHADPVRIRKGIELAKQRGDVHRVARGCAAMGALVDDPQPWLHEGYALVKRFGSAYGRGVFNDLMRNRGVAPTRSRSPRAALSSTEIQIIDLVSDGCTNRQVAMAVQASEKTVESHLTRLFALTGCRSRVELAAARLEGRLIRA